MITRRRALIILLTPASLFIAAGSIFLWYGRTPPDEFIRWARQNCIILRTPEPDRDFTDLEPLKRIVGDARLVALGEDSHGAREIFQLKHRILEFLVDNLGFTAFALEADLVQGLRMNEYVLGGKGNPEELLRNFGFWTCDTEEVLALILWMRRHNEASTQEHKVRFYGIDMQNPTRAVRTALAFLERVDSPFANQIRPVLLPAATDTLDGRRALAKKYLGMSREDFKELRSTIEGMISRPRANREPYVRQTSVAEWGEALRAAIVASQSVQHRAATLRYILAIPLNRRDAAMAENLLWALDREGPNGRMVLWAHNGHISRTSSYPGVVRFMGGHLDQALGDKMLAVGLVFNRGTFQAMDFTRPKSDGGGDRNPTLQACAVGPADGDSLEGTLARVGPPLFFLDLRSAPSWGPVHRWLWWPHRASSLAAAFVGRRTYSLTSARLSYDALCYFDEVSRARSNRPPGQELRRD